jgi:pyridoxal phosphate enzyme (YggS family)
MAAESIADHGAQATTAGDVAARLATVKGEIAAAARRAGRAAEQITLVAVTKTHAADRILPALVAGHRHFGENRVQEAEAKWPALRAAYPDLVLHLIGPLQRNKARRAVRLFDVIETLDSAELARALARIMAEEGRRPEVYVEVNIAAEPQKAGADPAETPALVRLARDALGLPVVGLMAIPPVGRAPAPYFARLRALAAECGLAGLSMGMSDDFAIAIAEGATSVRIGTAIFGHRPAADD